MDLDTKITISGESSVMNIPIGNLLRLSMIYMEPLVNEFLRDGHGSSIREFFDWLRKDKMKMKDSDRVLL